MAEKNWLKIGEVAQSLGISPKELRYWELVVPEIRPRRSRGNLRYYHREELPRLARIRDWLGEGLTVADCRQLLLTGQLKQDLGLELEAAPPPPSEPPSARDARELLAGVEKARRALTDLLERLSGTPRPALRKRSGAAGLKAAKPLDAQTAEAPTTAASTADAPPAPPPARSAKSRKKPPAPPSDPDSFGPLFDLTRS